MVAVPSVRVGPPLTSDRLTVFPLYLEAPAPVAYRLADDALADGTAVVTEIGEGGSVPQLAVKNDNDTLVPSPLAICMRAQAAAMSSVVCALPVTFVVR